MEAKKNGRELTRPPLILLNTENRPLVFPKGRGGNVITKIRTVHARGNFVSQISDDTVLYLNENKKETDKWFQAQGQPVPMRGTKYGFIRSITLTDELVNSSFSSDDLNAEVEKLLDRYESGGEMSREEFLQEMDDLYGRAVENYGAFEKGEYNETDIPVSLHTLESQQLSVVGSQQSASPITLTVGISTIADLFSVVKQKGKTFNPKPANPMFLNEDGTPKKFYHGSKKGGGFTEFKNWQYFTENKSYAERKKDRGRFSCLLDFLFSYK